MTDLSEIQTVAMAQNAEDVVLLRAFDHIGCRSGFYVDAGAGDPVIGSLTWNLVHQRGWTGMDVEPQADRAQKLRADRPQNQVVECALGEESGELLFFRLSDNWGMSTLDPEIAARHRESGWEVEEIRVPLRRLDELIDELGVGQIDLLKIDVEGFERQVILGADLATWHPTVLVIEATAPAATTPTHSEWEELVLEAGYQLCLFDGLNRFYVWGGHEDAELLAQELSVPANVFDRYIPARWWVRFSDEQKDALDPARKLPREV